MPQENILFLSVLAAVPGESLPLGLFLTRVTASRFYCVCVCVCVCVHACVCVCVRACA